MLTLSSRINLRPLSFSNGLDNSHLLSAENEPMWTDEYHATKLQTNNRATFVVAAGFLLSLPHVP